MKNKKNNKIAIITWHYFDNYGSALQSYAIQKALSIITGLKTCIINYQHKNFRFNAIKSFLRSVPPLYYAACFIFRKKRAFSFYHFLKKRLPLTRSVKRECDFDKICRENRYLCCGSDQIWSPNVFDDKYFLSFSKTSNVTFSYAPSVVIEPYKELVSKYSYLLNRINYISVREPGSLNNIYNLTSKPIVVVPDPTFLLDVREWNKIKKSPHLKTNSHFIFLYFLSKPEEMQINSIFSFANENGYEVFCVFDSFSVDSSFKYRDCKSYGPDVFLWFVSNADYIFTDSYHCFIFSLLHEKTFYIFKRFSNDDRLNQNARVDYLINYFELSGQYIEKGKTFNSKNKVIYDYEYKRKKELLINKGLTFLEGVFNEK